MTLSPEMIDKMIFNLIGKDPKCIELIKPSYLDDEIWRYAIDLDPTVFQFNKKPSESLCYYALKRDGNNMKWCNQYARKFVTRNFCMKALRYDPISIIYIPDMYIKKKMLIKTAERNFSIVSHFPLERFPKSFIKNKIIENPHNIRYIQNPPDDLIYLAVKAEPLCAGYFENLPEKVKEMLWVDFPNTAQCIENSKNK